MHTYAWSLIAVALVSPALPASALEADGQALAFASAREGTSIFEPRVAIANHSFVVKAGDALEYEVRVPATCADLTGVEILFADGRRTEAARVTVLDRWTHVRLPLDAFVGAEATRFEIVARGALANEIGFLVDDVVVMHAEGDPLVAFRDGLQSGARIVRDEARHAGVMLVDAGARTANGRLLLDPASVVEPWTAYDTTNLRRGDAGVSVGESSLNGTVLVGPCVPMRFALAGEKASVRATGQRLAFEPLEGGRFYTLWLAVSSVDGAPISTRASGVGDAGERCVVDVVVPARGSANEASLDLPGCTLLEIPIAARVPLHGIELPNEPRLCIHALTIHWRKDGLGNAPFRLGWLAQQARNTRGMADLLRRHVWRYVRNRQLAPMFGDTSTDEEGDRELFNALVNGDTPAFEAALMAQISEQAKRGEALANLHVALEDVRAGREVLEVHGGESGEALLRALASKSTGAALAIEGEVGELQQAPQLMSALGLGTVLLPPGPIIARWKGPDGSSARVLAPLRVLSDSREFGDIDWRRWVRRARAGGATPTLFVSIADTSRARADANAIVALLGRLDCAPRTSLDSAEAFLTQAEARLGAQVQAFTPGDLNPIADDRARTQGERTTGKRLAEAAVAGLQTFATLARTDGSPYPQSTIESLRASIDDLGDADVTARSVAIVERAETELGSALGVIARAANTLGKGTPVIAFNPLPWARRTLVQLEAESATLIASDGSKLPSQASASGTRLYALDLPPLGYEVLHALQGESNAAARTDLQVVVQGLSARNGELAFSIDPSTGALASLVLLSRGTEMLAQPALFTDGVWQVESAAFVETGPLRAVARVVLNSDRGRATIEFVLAARSKVLEVHIAAEGATDARPLAWRVPSRYSAPRAAISTPFGFGLVGARADGTSNRHRLTDWIVSTDGRLGIAVLAGKSASALVEPAAIAIECDARATATFALMPFAGGWRRASIDANAAEFAAPVHLLATDAHDGARGARHTFMSFTRFGANGQVHSGSGAGVVLSSLEPALDGNGWLVRFVETSGSSADLSITFDRPVFAAERVDLRGNVLGALRIEERSVRLLMGSSRIETIRVRLHP